MAYQGICVVSGCDNTLIVARNLCDNHYRRWKRHADPLGGRIPPGEQQRFFNEVVLAYDGNHCLIWPFNRNSTGYGQMSRIGAGGGKKDLVHRKVCERVHGRAPTMGHQAAHSCGNGGGGCCAKRHLSWKTPGGNTADKYLHGTINRGERGTAKLTEADVHEIRHRIETGETQRSIAKAFGVHFGTINHIHRGDTWSWLI